MYAVFAFDTALSSDGCFKSGLYFIGAMLLVACAFTKHT